MVHTYTILVQRLTKNIEIMKKQKIFCVLFLLTFFVIGLTMWFGGFYIGIGLSGGILVYGPIFYMLMFSKNA